MNNNTLNALSGAIALPLVDALYQKYGSQDGAVALYTALNNLSQGDCITEVCMLLEVIVTLSEIDVPPFETYLKTKEDCLHFIGEVLEDLYEILSDAIQQEGVVC